MGAQAPTPSLDVGVLQDFGNEESTAPIFATVAFDAFGATSGIG
jgi:hypothetical protein